MCIDGFGEYVGHSLPDGTHQLYAVPPMRLPDGLEAAAVAWKVVFTQVDQESNTFTAMYSDKAEVERWVQLHEVADFRADITPLYAAPVVPVAVNDDMAYAFHHALSDSSLGADEVEEIKTGLRAAFANVTTQPAPVVPDDWQLVPKKITLEMECALSKADSYEIGWLWALAAAPKYEVQGDKS